MGDMCNLSIIVPIYNGNQNLKSCLEALLNQNIGFYEIILVDDGSKDKKIIELLDSYSKKYDHVSVYHIPNQGVWNARKFGISMAKGKWIGFCDSDDIVLSHMYEKLFSKGEQDDADMVVCGFNRIDIETNKPFSTEMINWKKDNLDVQSSIGELCLINTALWNKIYKKEILKKVIDFTEPPRIAEDMMFLLSIYPDLKKVSFVNEALYQYFVHKNSAIQNVKKQDCEKTMLSMALLKDTMQNRNVSDEWIELVDIMAFIHIGISLPVSTYGKLMGVENKEILIDTKRELENKYVGWKTTKYLKWSYICSRNTNMCKIKIMQIVYCTGLFPLFLKVYNFMIRKLKKDIKW